MKFVSALLSSFVMMTGAALAADKDTCQPQPYCRLEYIGISPGAPGTGLKPQGEPPERGPGIIVNGIRPNDMRDTYRIPDKVLK